MANKGSKNNPSPLSPAMSYGGTYGLLRQSNEILITLIKSSPLAIIALDRTANVLIWNPAAEHLFGWKEKEVIGRPYPLVPESELAGFKALIEREFRGIRHNAVELKRLHKNGTLIDVNIWTAPLHDADDHMYGVLGMLADISERKKVEQLMRLQSAALQASANAIMITDITGKVQWTNQAFTSLTGYKPEEVIGKNPRQLVKSGKHDQTFYKNLWETILAGSIWNGETINRRKDGSHYIEDQTIAPVRNERNEITHFIAIKQDITKRKETEEALGLFRALLDQTQDAIEILDPESGRFLDANEKAYSELGYTREEFLNLRVFDIDPSLDKTRFNTNIEKLRKSGFLNWEGSHKRKDGSIFPVEINLKYVSMDRNYIVAVYPVIAYETELHISCIYVIQ